MIFLPQEDGCLVLQEALDPLGLVRFCVCSTASGGDPVAHHPWAPVLSAIIL
jgi:hypothetical protein